MKKPRFLIIGMTIGLLLILSPTISLFGSVFGAQYSWSVLGDSGVSDPKALASSIGMTLFFSMLWIAALPLGLILFVLCLVFFLRRPPAPPRLPTT